MYLFVWGRKFFLRFLQTVHTSFIKGAPLFAPSVIEHVQVSNRGNRKYVGLDRGLP